MDSRRLHLAEGFSSLYTYCTRVLHLGENAAYKRIEAARLSRRFPIVIGLIADGAITLTNLHLLGPYLTAENHRQLLSQAAHRSKHDVAVMVAELRRQAGAPLTTELDEVSLIKPIAADRYELQCTIGKEAHDELIQVQNLLRHAIPDGDVGAIVERAIHLLLEDSLRTRAAATRYPRAALSEDPSSRYIPAHVKRQVWARDGGRCAFVGTHGRCNEQGFLQFHHVIPAARGGRSDVPNIQLRCGPP